MNENCKREGEEYDEDNTSTEIWEAETSVVDNILPDKSGRVYKRRYEEFVEWQTEQNITSVSEDTMLVYFKQLSTKFKPSSLWAKYSMLKRTILTFQNVNIGKYKSLTAYLAQNSKGFKSTQSNTLKPEEVEKFLYEAPDNKYLAIKAALIFAIAGACRREELKNITMNDIEHHDNVIVVTIHCTKNNVRRKFTISGEFYNIVRKYEALRPKHTDNGRFFLGLRNGKCTQQAIGIHTIGAMPKLIAKYLGLEHPERYTGHSFLRTSVTMFQDAETRLCRPNHLRRRKSVKAAQACVVDSVSSNTEICNQICNFVDVDRQSLVKTEVPAEEKMDFDNCKRENEECDEDNTSTEIWEAETSVVDNILPDKTDRLYKRRYEEFVRWQTEQQITSVSEDTMLVYFEQLSTKFKPSSLWAKFSMLKRTILAFQSVNIGKYRRLTAYLAQNSKGFKSIQSNTLKPEEVEKFLYEAPDKKYLAIKATLIFAITGACRREELKNITMNDIEHHDNVIIVTIHCTKNGVPRKFTISGEFYNIVRKYEALRPKHVYNDRFFLCLRNGKCTQQAIGINTIGAMPKLIAKYLGLEHPERYTGHSFLRTSLTMFEDAEARLRRLKRFKKRKSITAAQARVVDSLSSNKEMSNQICNFVDVDQQSFVNTEIPAEEKMEVETIVDTFASGSLDTQVSDNENSANTPNITLDKEISIELSNCNSMADDYYLRSTEDVAECLLAKREVPVFDVSSEETQDSDCEQSPSDSEEDEEDSTINAPDIGVVVKNEYNEIEFDSPTSKRRERETQSRTPASNEFGKSLAIGKNGHRWYLNPCERISRTESPVTVASLRGPVGEARKVRTAFEAWSLFFPDDLLEKIVLHTNQEIESGRIVSELTVKMKCAYELTLRELKAFIGLLYFSGLQKANNTNTEELWSPQFGSMLYRSTMSATRFQFLLSVLRFDDKQTREERRAIDKFAPIREVWDDFIVNCKKYYNPGDYCTVDEQLLGFSEYCPFRMKMPAKSEKCGIKIVMLNDARTFYMVNADPYVGRVMTETLETIPSYHVRTITEPIHGSNRNITCDNWFTSVEMVQQMQEEFSLTVVGAIRKSQRHIPEEFKTAGSVGSAKFGFDGNMTLVSYTPKSRKINLLLSSFHRTGEIDSVTGKPEIIRMYDSTKGATDTFDRLCRDFTTARRTSRWPTRVFYGMLDQGGINSHILYNYSNANERMDRDRYLKSLIMSLVEPELRVNVEKPQIQQAQRTFLETVLGIDGSQLDLTQSTIRRRCCECPQEKDRKTNLSCFSCRRPICEDHRVDMCSNCVAYE